MQNGYYTADGQADLEKIQVNRAFFVISHELSVKEVLIKSLSQNENKGYCSVGLASLSPPYIELLWDSSVFSPACDFRYYAHPKLSN